MFTGIIEEVGTIHQISPLGPRQSRLVIQCNLVQGDMKLGDSLAVNGVCLTVVRFSQTQVELEVSEETLLHTLLGKRKAGDRVNLERALAVGGRLGGHIVQGHVDAVGKLLRVVQQGDFYEMTLSLPPEIQRYVAHKGSITVDGISLTIARMDSQSFTLAIIPHTYQNTTLGQVKPGEGVHLESDVLARYLEALIRPAEAPASSKIDLDFLQKHGF